MTNELTQQHGRVLEALQNMDIAVEAEHPISVRGCDYQLDCWLPEFHACIEVDGPSHGMRGRKDRVRDELLHSIGIPTLRLKENGLRAAPVSDIAAMMRVWLDSVQEDVIERRKSRTKNALEEWEHTIDG